MESPPETVCLNSDPPGADILWLGQSLGKTGQNLSWSRDQFQDSPGRNARFSVILRKDGFHDQVVWLDADLWRYHQWPARGQPLALEPSRFDTRCSLWIQHWGVLALLSVLTATAWLAWLRRRASQQTRVLSSHLPALMGQAMAEGGHSVTLDVTVLFLDRLGSDKEPSIAYFEKSTRAITRHGGEVVRTVGEQILAIFPGQAGGAQAAVAASIEASQAHRLRGFKTHCGIHQGSLVSTSLGSVQRQWTLVGDNINVAARIHGLAKQTGATVLVSQTVKDQCLGVDFASRGQHALKGRRQPVDLFEAIIPPPGPALPLPVVSDP